MSLSGAAGAPMIAPPVPAPAGSPALPIAGSEPIATGTAAAPIAGAPATPMAAPAPAPVAGVPGSAGSPPAAAPTPIPPATAGGSAGMSPAATGGRPALEPGALQCPNEICAPLPALPPQAATAGFSIMLCCADSGDCGTSLNGGACTRTADSVPDCPSLSAMGFTVPSCCTPMGQCGIDGSSFMRGCMALEDLGATAGAFIEVPAPKACTPAM